LSHNYCQFISFGSVHCDVSVSLNPFSEWLLFYFMSFNHFVHKIIFISFNLFLIITHFILVIYHWLFTCVQFFIIERVVYAILWPFSTKVNELIVIFFFFAFFVTFVTPFVESFYEQLFSVLFTPFLFYPMFHLH
jgi:hypothetical protein